jgi:hypothetical protein
MWSTAYPRRGPAPGAKARPTRTAAVSGPRGNLQVRHFSNTRRVDPAGDASITLPETECELGDEADKLWSD